MNIFSNICFIPAKANSTRLFEKNILKINGKELIGYVIEEAKKSEIFKDILVSSESDKILEIAKKYGATILSKRPEYLSNDPYGVVDVLLNEIERNPKLREFENVCISLPTSPLIKSRDFKKCHKFFIEENFECVMSVTESIHTPFRAITKLETGKMKFLFPEYINNKSQELETTYFINGAMTFTSIFTLDKYKNCFNANIGTYIMNRENSIDIDTIDDYLFAKFLIESKCNKSKLEES